MARGIYQSDHTSAPHPAAEQVAKRREHDANGTHRWHESTTGGTRQRQCTVKACATIETWSERAGEWI